MNLHPLLSLGILFLSGLAVSGILRRLSLPSVTSYLLLGIAAGPLFADAVSSRILEAGGLISTLVLSIISFSLGQNFSLYRLKEIGKTVLYISLAQSLAAAVFTGVAVYLITGSGFLALSFSAIAPATAPAAVVIAVRELKAKGRFTDTLLGVVAFSDVWGLMIFAFILPVITERGMLSRGLMHGLIEITVSAALGLVTGFLFSYFSKFIKNASELLIYTLGFILLNAGLALISGASVLLSCMIMSAVLVNIDRASFRFFEVLRSIDAPFYLVFFVLAGASLEVNLIGSVGLLGGIYIAARMIGKLAGVWSAAVILRTPDIYRKYLGLGLAPQAGVALGMAMVLHSFFPKSGGYVLSTIITTTVVYEIFGPLFTKYAIIKSGEAALQ